MAHRQLLSCSSLCGDKVRNSKGENLGKIEDIMIDLLDGRIGYAVLSFGGFVGIGEKLFAVPWSVLQLDQETHEFVLDVDKETLKNAPGFDKDNWPDFAEPAFGTRIHVHYKARPYWETTALPR